ncbi:MAG: hypothetical protein P4L64_07505 [Caulobacteraceae bacterium]|nr:hypothetical protein [Caulobacteraceae bacterium]
MTPTSEVQRTFLIEIQDEAEAVLRVLGAFALGGARLTGLDLRPQADNGLRLQVTAANLDEPRSASIAQRLGALPIVRAVSFGWRST